VYTIFVFALPFVEYLVAYPKVVGVCMVVLLSGVCASASWAFGSINIVVCIVIPDS
jgi:hypothetical protein